MQIFSYDSKIITSLMSTGGWQVVNNWQNLANVGKERPLDRQVVFPAGPKLGKMMNGCMAFPPCQPFIMISQVHLSSPCCPASFSSYVLSIFQERATILPIVLAKNQHWHSKEILLFCQQILFQVVKKVPKALFYVKNCLNGFDFFIYRYQSGLKSIQGHIFYS